jgi:hypothetical protein
MTQTTTSGIQSLLNRVIDYAGLFPPAKLDMASTVANYHRYLTGEHAWMLGRLIVPVNRLDEFEEHAMGLLPKTAGDEIDLWQISALTAPAGSAEFASDVARIEQFNQDHERKGAGRAIIDVIEIKVDAAGGIDEALDVISDDVFPFFELPIDRDPRGLLASLVDGEAGAKVRTGGMTADLYPSPENLARFIHACAAVNVPFKATAGMHHPLRRFSKTANAMEFGFLNLFIAGCLAMTDELSPDEIRAILEMESPDQITINDSGIAWQSHQLDVEDVQDVREEFAISFGSCSFDEPIADLQALKLL